MVSVCAVADTPWTVIGITLFVSFAIVLTVVIAVVKNCTLKPPVDLSVVTEVNYRPQPQN